MLEQCDYLNRINSLLPKLVAYAYDCLGKNTTLSEEYDKCGDPNEIIEKAKAHWISITQDGGKTAISKRWSNIYCANSFDTKVRCAGVDLSSHCKLRDRVMIEELAKVEHNRWVIEQLLLGIRPVDRSYAGRLPIEDKDLKKELKAQNIHADLVSNDILGSSQSYDEEIAMIIPLAYAIIKQADPK